MQRVLGRLKTNPAHGRVTGAEEGMNGEEVLEVGMGMREAVGHGVIKDGLDPHPRHLSRGSIGEHHPRRHDQGTTKQPHPPDMRRLQHRPKGQTEERKLGELTSGQPEPQTIAQRANQIFGLRMRMILCQGEPGNQPCNPQSPQGLHSRNRDSNRQGERDPEAPLNHQGKRHPLHSHETRCRDNNRHQRSHRSWWRCDGEWRSYKRQ